jgi:hypothetical protein
VIPFWDRPYRGIDEAVPRALLAELPDPELSRLPLGIGPIEQWVDNTDVLSKDVFRKTWIRLPGLGNPLATAIEKEPSVLSNSRPSLNRSSARSTVAASLSEAGRHASPSDANCSALRATARDSDAAISRPLTMNARPRRTLLARV